MPKLAIKGHATRGKEVIEILEMLGGINSHNLYGDENYAYYTIDSDKEIKGYIYIFGDEQLCSFTLEEFEEKFPYKIGDKVSVYEYESKVRIDDMKWDGFEIQYSVFTDETEWYSVEELNKCNEPYKEETMEVTEEFYNKHCVNCGSQRCTRNGEWLEGCEYYKEENMEERKYVDLILDVDQDDKLATEATIDGDKIIPPKNYLIGKITKVDNRMLVEFVKK